MLNIIFVKLQNMKKKHSKGPKIVFIPKKFLQIIFELVHKKIPVKDFAFQLEDLPIYIVYTRYSKDIDILTITDVGNTLHKTIKIKLHDRISNLFLTLAVIKEEYRQGVLFSNKSEFDK